MDILFYHLTETRMEDALPSLLEKSLERKWRIAVQTTGVDREAALDAHLWTYRADSFLPHGLASEEMADEQPILITSTDGNPNGAHIRFYVDGAAPDDIAGYERLVLMFDGHDEAQLAQARAQWKRLKAGGGQLSYWQQNNDGRWEKKA